MKKILMAALTILVLTGCESTKYSYNEVFGDYRTGQREYGTFQTKSDQGNSSWVEAADHWVKNHLW